MSTFWKSVAIPSGETRHWQISILDLWVQHREGEWRVWQEIQKGQNFESRFSLAEVSPEPEIANHVRFAFDSDDSRLKIQPAFPDRSIVSYPGSQIVLPPESEASFVCGIPLWIALSVGTDKKAVPLITLPLRPLPKTWFGTPDEGESCYSASTEAVRDYRQLAPNKYRALCPLKVKNKTKSHLPIDRICIHVEHLQLFEGKENLWTNEVFVNRLTEHGTSQVTFGSGAPSVDPNATLVLSPRETPTQNRLLLKTFNHLKSVLGDQ